jgi:phosphonate transport system ATP-binding protein
MRKEITLQDHSLWAMIIKVGRSPALNLGLSKFNSPSQPPARNRIENSMLQIKNVTKVYEGGVRALENVSFDAPKGQFLAVIGLSGSGKSTLLRCINRLIEPTDGQIIWEDTDITAASQDELRRIRRKIGMVFQHFNLVHRSSVITNVLAGRLGYINPAMSLLNRFPPSDVEKAMAQLERVGIASKANDRADELSGGQQQRVGIARALMQDPEIILADEPVASLDPVLAHSIMQYLERINQEDGVTVLCSLHFLDLVHRYADRVVALNEGRLVFDGLPDEIDDAKFKDIYGKDAERVG